MTRTKRPRAGAVEPSEWTRSQPARRASRGSSCCSPRTHSIRRAASTGTTTESIPRSLSAARRLTNAVKRVAGAASRSAGISARAATSMPPVAPGTRNTEVEPDVHGAGTLLGSARMPLSIDVAVVVHDRYDLTRQLPAPSQRTDARAPGARCTTTRRATAPPSGSPREWPDVHVGAQRREPRLRARVQSRRRRRATATSIVLINNDVECPPDFLERSSSRSSATRRSAPSRRSACARAASGSTPSGSPPMRR